MWLVGLWQGLGRLRLGIWLHIGSRDEIGHGAKAPHGQSAEAPQGHGAEAPEGYSAKAPHGQSAKAPQGGSLLDKPMSRRAALGTLLGGLGAGAGVAVAASNPLGGDDSREQSALNFEEFFKGNYQVMTAEEKRATITRLERLAQLERGVKVSISGAEAPKGVLFGYAFNISKCKGYLECVSACVKENNLDRSTGMQYIKIFEMDQGSMNLEHGRTDFYHQVPVPGKFYLGTQCFHCDNPPCTPVCPVGATWKEPDGIVVVDYDWCIGCRYCVAACPYWARRFNWQSPQIPQEEFNRSQHYLGNRPRKKGVVEKCTFCIQRTRAGKLPACVEACPTGARVFGNLLDPESEIRWVLENKKVFRLKEALNTEPKFWYYAD